MITLTNTRFFDFEKTRAPIKSIALVHKNLKPGGIETLIVRMAKWLSAHDYNVTLFLYSSGGPLLRELEGVEGVTVVVDEDTADPTVNLWLASKMISKRFATSFDFVYSFDPKSFLVSYLLPAKKRMSGVYHPESYSARNVATVIKTLKFIDSKFYKKLMFMNPSIKERTERAIGENLNDKFFPLPLDFAAAANIQGKFHSRRIVSIGQLAHFRTYNYYMIDIMENLIKLDPTFTYHIYGAGHGEDELREKIEHSPARDHIVLHGAFTARDKQQALRDTFCFVGMGVPLIEAAGCGIPAIVGKINDLEGVTEGFLHQLPAFESGESAVSEQHLVAVEEQIKQLMASEVTYKQIAKQERFKANEFESNHVMQNFIKHAEVSQFTFSRLH